MYVLYDKANKCDDDDEKHRRENSILIDIYNGVLSQWSLRFNSVSPFSTRNLNK